MKDYIKVFSNVFFIKGYKRSVIYDLQRNDYKIVSHNLYDFIKKNENNDIYSIKKKLNSNELKIFNETLKYLLLNEYIFICNSKTELKSFPKLALKYSFPSIISNAIVENPSINTIKNTIDSLESINVPHIQLKFFRIVSIDILTKILNSFDKSGFKSIEIVIPDSFRNNAMMNLSKKLLRPFIFILYGSCDKKNETFQVKKNITVFRTPKEIAEIKSGRIQDESYFRCNISLFTEAQSHHAYFHGKVYISENGDIKNAFELNEIYGNIHQLSSKKFQKILVSKKFQKYWFANKDKNDICKNCEFRYMCVDNRPIFIRNNHTSYHKIECNYNPFVGKWKGENGYINLKSAGINSENNGFTINKKVLNSNN